MYTYKYTVYGTHTRVHIPKDQTIYDKHTSIHVCVDRTTPADESLPVHLISIIMQYRSEGSKYILYMYTILIQVYTYTHTYIHVCTCRPDDPSKDESLCTTTLRHYYAITHAASGVGVVVSTNSSSSSRSSKVSRGFCVTVHAVKPTVVAVGPQLS